MKKLLILGIILACVNVQAMEKSLPVVAALPSAKDLHERFKSLNLAFFYEKSGIVQSLAGKTILPMIVVDKIGQAMQEYDKQMGDPNTLDMLNIRVPAMLRVILRDCPDALENLEAYGVLQ